MNYYQAKFLKNCGALSKIPEEIMRTPNKIFSQTSKDDSSLNSPLRIPGLHGMDDNLDHQSDPRVHSPQTLDSSDSPYPTPLNLTNEMQTPGTVYPVNLDSLRTGKHTRIRTQYVYPVLKPMENLPQWDALRRGSCQLVQSDDFFEQQLSSRTDSVERRNKVLLTPAQKSVDKIMPTDLALISGSRDQVDIEPDTPELIISSLSQWLKPKPLKNKNFDVTAFTANEQSCPVMNFDAERPIIGTVAAHWTDDNACPNSYKHWNGNGIPNSTTKYKEDQRVSWHATPFEERLDKVLSDENLLPQRYVTSYVIQAICLFYLVFLTTHAYDFQEASV
ncbi:hypothetical protein B296_00009595 [Ensete ventricosum]|uniref:Uncharacterized protein n=1 Tax=Ensete ventricosum TaxID=4639 RepID=A0A427AY95_ENSVE|nr:hypothetical protein B296_00009595 [Ensete ventricosum]